MEFIEIVLIALGLAMDAFVVSVAASASGMIKSKRAVFRLSFHFGLFQFFMPVLGWFAGDRVAELLFAFDHWIAFGLLLIVGSRMVLSGFKSEELFRKDDPSKGLNLVILSLATSIDAMAVGFSLAMIDINIWYPSVIIGVITSGLSLLGIRLGSMASKNLRSHMTILGGVILIIIGFRIMFENL